MSGDNPYVIPFPVDELQKPSRTEHPWEQIVGCKIRHRHECRDSIILSGMLSREADTYLYTYISGVQLVCQSKEDIEKDWIIVPPDEIYDDGGYY